MNSVATVDDLSYYINQVKSIPVLEEEEERLLAVEYVNTKDPAIAKKLITSSLRYVVYVANQYRGYKLPLMDLIQEGNMGLVRSLKLYDPSRGVRLVSFCTWWIKAEINNYIINNNKQVKAITTKDHRKLFYNLRKFKTNDKWLTNSQITDISTKLNVSEKSIVHMEQQMFHQDFQLDKKISDESDKDSSEMYLIDNRQPIDEIEKEEQSNGVSTLLDGLDNREKDIINSRYLSDDKLKLSELSERYSVSMERIRQIEVIALNKMRKDADQKTLVH